MTPLTMTQEEWDKGEAEVLAPVVDDQGNETGETKAICEFYTEAKAAHAKLEKLYSILDGIANLQIPSDVEHKNGTTFEWWLETLPAETRESMRKWANIALDNAIRIMYNMIKSREPGQQNYVTCDIIDGTEDHYSLTFQREDGMSPAIKIRDLEEDNQRLRAELAQLKAQQSVDHESSKDI